MAIELIDGVYKSYQSKQKQEAVYEENNANGKRIIVVNAFSGDDSIDLDDEIIDQTKWRSDSYLTKLVKFMPFHEYKSMTLGQHRWIKPFPNKKDATATKFQAQFGPHEFGIAFGELYLNGDMDSFSEGFKAFKWENPTEKGAQYSRKYIDQLRIEISAVSIPANRNARLDDMIKAFDQVNLSASETKAVIKEYLFEKSESGLLVEKGIEYYTIKDIDYKQKYYDSLVIISEQAEAILKKHYMVGDTEPLHDHGEEILTSDWDVFISDDNIEVDDPLIVDVDALDAEGDTLEVLVGVGDVQVDVEPEINVEI